MPTMWNRKDRSPAAGPAATVQPSPTRTASLPERDQTLRVRDLMTTGPLTLHPSDNLASLHDLMQSRHVRHIPVVDSDGAVVGLVTHRDLLRDVLSDTDL